jgi:hypothetical protein
MMKVLTGLAMAVLVMSSTVLVAHAQVDYQYKPGQPATASREQWKQLTAGDDLARGKKVFFSPAPNYRLTTDDNDPYDLTDGTLTSREDDRVWFNKDGVGFYLSPGLSNGILMMIDLGSVQPVGQIAIRVLGGHEQGSLDLPKSAEFLASADGEHYYSLQNLVKLNPAEANQADGKTGFYFPEEGKAFMAPLVCRQPVMARYIAIRVIPVNSLFTDQISVLKADASTPLKVLSSFPQAQVFTDGLAVLPRHQPFVVTTNIVTPNWLTILDNTNADLSKNPAAFRIELPKGLNMLPISKPDFKEVASPDAGMHSYEFQYNGKTDGPLWIEKDPAVIIPADTKVLLTGIVDGKDSHTVRVPLKLVAIPETHPIKGLDISLAWMNDSVEQQWPNFLRDFRKMGFNYVSTFPRYFGKNADGSWNDATQKNLAFLQQARQEGYGIVYDESAFHVMWNTVQSDLKRGKIDDAEADQLFTQIDGKRGKWMNILYRGKYFQNEMKRVANLAALVQPDQVYFDIEWWTQSVNESKKDPRVVAAWKASGKDWDDFVTDIGREVLGDLVSTMRQAVPNRKMTVGLYNSDPKNAIYNSVFGWDKIYPGIVDIAQPSLYVQGRANIVADRIRYDYDAMQAKQIIPWLSAGTYGEYDPKLTEPMVLESILNGSRGVTYYWFGDFDPMDFYYHSKAISELAPYETLLQNGKPIAYKTENADLHYTAFASDNEALVLVENFSGTSNSKVTLKSPIASAAKVLLDGKTLPLQNNAVSIDVPPNEFRLVYFGK